MINIAKLLKDAPKGMKLYSPLFGVVEFAEVMDTGYMPIRVTKRGYGLRFDEYGRYLGSEYPDAECLLFPSKEVHTWEGWKPPIKSSFKVGDWIIYNGEDAGPTQIIDIIKDNVYICKSAGGLHGNYNIEHTDRNYHLWTIADAKDGDVLAAHEVIVLFKEIDGLNIRCHFSYHYMNTPMVFTNVLHNKMAFRPATKDECELLFAKMKEVGYQWDAEKKELKKIQPHYDIKNFHAGMPVLVRIDNSLNWSYALFSHYNKGWAYPFSVASCCSVKQCIPFNNETKHLLGTTDMCDEKFINW